MLSINSHYHKIHLHLKNHCYMHTHRHVFQLLNYCQYASICIISLTASQLHPVTFMLYEKCHHLMLLWYLTCIISNIIVWVKAANVMWLYHMLVPNFSVVWIMQHIIYLLRTYFSKHGTNLKDKNFKFKQLKLPDGIIHYM